MFCSLPVRLSVLSLAVAAGCGTLDPRGEDRSVPDQTLTVRASEDTVVVLDEFVFSESCWTVELPDQPGQLDLSLLGTGDQFVSIEGATQYCDSWGFGGARCSMSSPDTLTTICAEPSPMGGTFRVRYTPGSTGLSLPDCEDDAHEPNDALWEYRPMPANEVLYVTPESPADVFALVVPPGQSAEVHHVSPGIDLVLYTNDGTYLGSADLSSTGFRLSVDNPGDGYETYLVAVLAVDDWTCSPYALTTTFASLGGECATTYDTYDTPSWPLEQADGSLSDADPSDWYAYWVPAGDTLTVAALFLHDDGDVDLELTDPADGTDLAGAVSASDDELLVWTNTGPGREVRLEVELYGASDCVDYALFSTID